MARPRKFKYRVQRFAKGRGKGKVKAVGSRRVVVNGTIRRPGQAPVKAMTGGKRKKQTKEEAGSKLKSKLLGKYRSKAKKRKK